MLPNSKLIWYRHARKPFALSHLPFAFLPFPKDTMKIPIPKNRMEIKNFSKDFDLDLALVILLTFLCVPFVLIPPLNDTFFYKKNLC